MLFSVNIDMLNELAIKAFIKPVCKSMKKVIKAAIVFAIVLMLGTIVGSCKSSHECSSFEEVRKFQRDSRR